jgi:uncharacterized protein
VAQVLDAVADVVPAMDDDEGEEKGEGAEKDKPAQDEEAKDKPGDKPEGAKDEETEEVDKAAMDAAIKAATKGMVTRVAMDAAIAEAARKATADALSTANAIRDAERAVRPYVGDLAMAHDSAEAVYRTALTTLGVNVEGVHASAFPTILGMQRKASDPAPKAKPTLAQDAKADAAYAERFPHATRLKN